jgi:DNA polymerase I-like protein with 3'-5' exonuclease and polymerase domains
MNLNTKLPYHEVWLCKFIFHRKGPILPHPICLVAYELKSGRLLKIFQDELTNLTTPPFDTGDQNLFVSYFIPDELHCHLALDWPLPVNIIDLFPEFRCSTNGLKEPKKSKLTDALKEFKLSPIDESLEASVEQMVLKDGPWSQTEKQVLFHYGELFVASLVLLLDKMEDHLVRELSEVMQRSRYMVAITKMESYGIPIETERLMILKDKWSDIRETLILEVKDSFHIYDKSGFKTKLFEKYLESQDIPWSKTKTGRLDLRKETFLQMGESYPQIQPLAALRRNLSNLNKLKITVDPDGRTRCELKPFMTITGRNAPSSNKFMFNLPKWLRSLIKPREGYGLAYLDWNYQEIGIAAALSDDSNLKNSYLSGDPYVAFAKEIGAIPEDGTKESYREIRDLFKEVVLAVQYGMSAKSLAKKIEKTETEARELLNQHKQTYPTFWKWSDDNVNYYNTKGELWSGYGWYLRLGADKFKELSIRNFLMQSNGSEMLRLACTIALENNIKVIATVHDGILIEFPLEQSEEQISIFKEIMLEASRRILEGFELSVDVLPIFYPERFKDPDGQPMWELVWSIISEPDNSSIGITPCSKP